MAIVYRDDFGNYYTIECEKDFAPMFCESIESKGLKVVVMEEVKR